MDRMENTSILTYHSIILESVSVFDTLAIPQCTKTFFGPLTHLPSLYFLFTQWKRNMFNCQHRRLIKHLKVKFVILPVHKSSSKTNFVGYILLTFLQFQILPTVLILLRSLVLISLKSLHSDRTSQLPIRLQVSNLQKRKFAKVISSYQN